MPSKVLKLPKNIYYNNYGISYKPIGNLLESNHICNMDTDKFTIPFYKSSNDMVPIPIMHPSFKDFKLHNFLKYGLKNRCCICGVNPINAYFFPCKHGKICIICAMSYQECPKCNLEYDIICRITLCPDDVFLKYTNVAQPCGHVINSDYTKTCPICNHNVTDIDIVKTDVND